MKVETGKTKIILFSSFMFLVFLTLTLDSIIRILTWD